MVSLAEVVSQDLNRTHLQLSLSSLPEVTDAEVVSIANCLPPNLLSVDLNFAGCANVTVILLDDQA